jgi:hypothetical protein
MSVETTDVKFKKSVTVTDTVANGGRKGDTQVLTGVRHSLFPRVSYAERTAGVTRYRKEFFCNENVNDDVAYDLMVFLEFPSTGGDRFYIGKGTQTDIQDDLEDYDPIFVGCGQLHTALAGSETSVVIDMEYNDFQFLNGGYLHISDKFMTSQTIDSSVKVGDSVQLTAGTWYTIASTDDVAYPNGVYVGGNMVLTVQATTNEEWLQLADYEYTNEAIGTGNGSNTAPTLSTLSHKTNGVCRQPDKLPEVTATCGGVTRTVNVASDGTCSGYCSAGELNMATGAWTTKITWTTAPDNGTSIHIDYYENCFKYTGNTVTVYLETGTQVANAYLTTNTYCSGCIECNDVETSYSGWAETAAASGTYDETTYPPIFYNDGTEYDLITITFTSATNFTCAGAYEGDLGTGNAGVDFEPTNADTGEPYFTIDASGWGGTWQSGDTIEFTTIPSAFPIWIKEVVPAGTAQEPNNLVVIGAYWE